MSGPDIPSGGAKTVSSRLLTMKFMQRAAASASNRSPRTSTASQDSPSTPTQDPHAAKRRKVSSSVDSPSSSHPSTPATPGSTAPVDFSSSVSAAVAAEEAARAEALARHSGVTAETRWVLSYPGPSRETSLSEMVMDVDADADADVDARVSGSSFEEAPVLGRRTYGDFKRRKKFEDGVARAEGGEDEANGEDGEHEEQEVMEAVFASKAQKKLREGANPDRVNLKGLKGHLSGFRKREGGHDSRKNGAKKRRATEKLEGG